MKKVFQAAICLTAAAVFTFSGAFFGMLSAFYSAWEHISGGIGTGSVEAVIDNPVLTDGNIDWSEAGGNQYDGVLTVNSSDLLTFAVRNEGLSELEFDLWLELGWDSEMPEGGKLFVYPAELTDEEIFDNLSAGDYTGVLAGADFTEEEFADGELYGLRVLLDSGILNSADGEGSPAPLEYRCKIFFFEDEDVTADPEMYHDAGIVINLILQSDVFGRATGWASQTKSSLYAYSVINTVFPVIHEVANQKIFFVDNGGDIDLLAYAQATDTVEGDITGRITHTVTPEFDPGRAGEYTVVYEVVNKFGNSAVPLIIRLVIWDFVKITSGYYHTLALTSHGKVYAWGYNGYGQIGDGTTTDRSKPILLTALESHRIVDVAGGVGCSYALTADGQIYAWGRNENGRLGDGTTTARNSPVKVKQPEGVVFVQISGRYATAGAVTADGDVYTWGAGAYGAAGNGGTADNHVPTKIALSGIAQVEMGYYNGGAVAYDGTLYTWGDNLYGQLGKGSAGSSNSPIVVPYFRDGGIAVKSISVGWYHMAAVTETGGLYTWGYGLEGRLGLGSTTNYNSPQAVSLPYPVTKALAGYYQSGALTTQGTAYFFGQNAYGKLGTGNTTNQNRPVLLSINGVTDISLAFDSSFVLVNSRTVFGMGYGGTGVLGTGNNNNSATPVEWVFVE